MIAFGMTNPESTIARSTPSPHSKSTISQENQAEFPEVTKWAKDVAARHNDRVAVGTVFASNEINVVQAIDDYAAKHALESRGAVVRESWGQLLGIEVTRQ
jgi:hypothetical protein